MIKYIIFMFVTLNCFAVEKPKTYTDQDFKKAVREEMKKKLEDLGSKRLVKYFKGLLEKENQMEAKEIALSQREKKLQMSIKHFDERIKKLTGKQNKIIGCLDDIQKGEEGRVQNMVDIISNMKASKAAEILSVQDSDITIKILRKLEPLKVSKLFNQMDKEISARLQKQFLTMER